MQRADQRKVLPLGTSFSKNIDQQPTPTELEVRTLLDAMLPLIKKNTNTTTRVLKVLSLTYSLSRLAEGQLKDTEGQAKGRQRSDHVASDPLARLRRPSALHTLGNNYASTHKHRV